MKNQTIFFQKKYDILKLLLIIIVFSLNLLNYKMTAQFNNIYFTYPQGSETIFWSDTIDIKWDSFIDSVSLNIYLWDGTAKQYYFVDSNISVTQKQINWIVPQNISGDRFRFLINARDSLNSYCMTGTYFSIYSGRYPVHSEVNETYIENFINKMILFPNPANKSLIIDWSNNENPESYKIVNQLGITVKSFSDKINKPITINLENLVRGSYFLISYFPEKIYYVNKFIVE